MSSTITGGSIAEVICGFDGDDTLTGKGGGDVLQGGTGDDTLSGNGGDDELNGEGGNDVSNGDDGDDTIVDFDGSAWADGGNDDDFIWTGAGDDVLFGGSGADVIVSGPGGDFVEGGSGNDSLGSAIFGQTSIPDDDLGGTYCGGAGNDTINLRGAAHQCADGGDGTDYCSYAFFVTTRTADGRDIGTGLSCETEVNLHDRVPLCGCP